MLSGGIVLVHNLIKYNPVLWIFLITFWILFINLYSPLTIKISSPETILTLGLVLKAALILLLMC